MERLFKQQKQRKGKSSFENPSRAKTAQSRRAAYWTPLVYDINGRSSPVVKVWDRGWLVTSLSPLPLKTRRVGQRCTLNLSRAQTSSHWCGSQERRIPGEGGREQLYSLRRAAVVAEWSRYRIVAGLVTSSSPFPLKTRRVELKCPPVGVVVRRGAASSGVVHVT
ncbi:hypothetical protein TNCV_534951 [Trichonephila clavipes]|nr:hypothetical protein TNCV_534951 [Trichonephila clavipes]